MISRHIAKSRGSQERHRALNLAPEDVDRPVDADFSRGSKAPQEGPPNPACDSSKPNRFHDVGATPNSSIEEDLGAASDDIRDIGQSTDRRHGAVKLAPAVIGHDKGIRPNRNRLLSIPGM